MISARPRCANQTLTRMLALVFVASILLQPRISPASDTSLLAVEHRTIVARDLEYLARLCSASNESRVLSETGAPGSRAVGWEYWKERNRLLNRRVVELGSKAQIIFIGDSITEGWEHAGKDVWAKYYSDRNAINLGIGGDGTEEVLWRLSHGNLEGLAPKVAVLMIGTNHVGQNVEQITEGVAAIVRLLREKLPKTKILLLGILPRDEPTILPYRGEYGVEIRSTRGTVLMVNQVVQNFANGNSVFWLDFGHLFVDAKGQIRRELMPDTRHPSAEGYAVWASAMESILTKLME